VDTGRRRIPRWASFPLRGARHRAIRLRHALWPWHRLGHSRPGPNPNGRPGGCRGAGVAGEGFEDAAGLGDGGAAAGGFGQEGVEGWGEGAGELWGEGALGEDGGSGEVAAVACERGLTLDRKEQDRPQGPEVGRRARGVASDLLGGEERGRGRAGVRGGAEGGQADAGQAGAAVGGDQDAGRAQVEVVQAGGMGRLQGVEQLKAELGHPADRQGAVPGDQLVEGEGVDQLGGHVHDAVLDNHVVQPDQAGMLKGGRDPRLGRDPVPDPRLPAPTGTRPALTGARPVATGTLPGTRRGREAELLDGEGAAVGVGGPPDQAVLCAAQRGLQRPAACDEPPADVL
jgi:hypothetical protein